MNFSRRRFLIACGAPAPLLLLASSAAKAARCADPDELSSAEIGMRDSLGYRSVSVDSAKACKHCKFYDTDGNECGSCQILGGKVDATGHCASWTRRTG